MSGALLAAVARPAFGRHETFHLRFGWLRKAYEAANEDPRMFSRPDATVQLGVGKNMVNAMRYWGLAYRILEEAPDPSRPRMPLIVPSVFGSRLLREGGWDPYLEDPASLWLLHWHLLEPGCLAPVWWIAFNMLPSPQFDDEGLVRLTVDLTTAAGWSAVMESTIKKDVDCLLRTFVPRRVGRQSIDDVLDCPTRELGLVQPVVGETRSWRFESGAKPTLPAEIVAYASLRYLASAANADRTISISRLASDAGGPGRVFRMTESALYEALEGAARDVPELSVVEPAGLRQLVVDGDPRELADRLLVLHYAPERMAA